MPRKNGPLIPDDPATSRAPVPAREDLDDALDSRVLDLDAEEEPAFLRAQKRVPVRRGPLPKKAANRLKIALIVCAVAGVIGGISLMTYRYGAQSWRFRLDSSDQLEVSGIRHVSRAQIMDVMGGDIGRNVFFIPLADRQKQLEEIPWVEGASVMRLLPNRIKIDIR
ncbi:MAG: FtsQ-type POTRA domain-containing protein [Acidobacteriia bacterium]|nr:FtsQ-type POTRA domain-containing protein [Terriglobia bacterium]